MFTTIKPNTTDETTTKANSRYNDDECTRRRLEAPANDCDTNTSIDGNCVCDISMLEIVDKPVVDVELLLQHCAHDGEAESNCCAKNSDNQITSTMNDKNTKEEARKAHADKIELEVEVEDAGEGYEADINASGLARLYLNDVEIQRSAEEQTINELVATAADDHKVIMETGQHNSVRIALGIILRLVLPLANGVARGIQGIRDVRFLRALKNIASSRQAFTNLIAFAANTISMNLSSVQVSHRIEPILKLMKIRKSHDGNESLPDMPTTSGGCTPITPTTPTTPILHSPYMRETMSTLPHFASGKRRKPPADQPAPKCCTLNVLAEPPAGDAIRADIVFIHGLHGSLKNTWKQGLWENDRRPVEFQRPPKPPVRPPKRPRHTRSIRPLHKEKRARITQSRSDGQISANYANGELGAEHFDSHEPEENCDFSYVCGEPQDIQICDDIEYSFPTFRLRMNDNSRLLQAELESIIKDENVTFDSNEESTNKNKKRSKSKSAPKPSSNDPDYSKCWPGDWLPLDCPGVRVIAVNYTTDQYLWRPLWKKKEPRTNLAQRAREMAELLIEQRVGCGHPIVWVGHSKGGLFIKQLIVDAWESGRPAMEPFWRSSRGVFFYSVPHRGSHLASVKAPLLTRSVELLDIEKNNKYLLDLHRRFAGLYQLGLLKIEVFSFVETALTLMSVLYLRIVGVDSADPGIGDVCGIRLDHREICKPRSRECILYKELVKMIEKVC